MDLATVVGLIGTIVIIGVVMIMDGGSPAELFHHSAPIILTMGGSAVAATVFGPLQTVLNIPKFLKIAFFETHFDTIQTIDKISEMADKARREGLLALEEESKTIEDKFLQKGIMLVVDGIEPAAVRTILELEIHQMEQRHHQGISWFETAGGLAPTFGIIGTVMGLISVLKQLDDPAAFTAAIAAAFLATLWGLISANVFWLPIGGKLTTRSHHEVSYRHMLLEGVMALQAGENPRLIREKLNAFLSPAEREKSVDKPASAAGKAGAAA